MDRGDLANLAAFVTVADQRSFRAAASRIGVTPSALSHSMRLLEERLGIRLLHRTTRSVSATDAGQRLLEQLRPAINQIAGALENLNQERQRPRGRLRIYATSHLVATAVVVPIWERFLSTYPEVHLELHVGDAPIDIVAEGYDAGLGPQDRAAADMIAVRVTGPMRIAIVGAPAYFARQRAPRTPEDLARHRCVQYPSGWRGHVGVAAGTERQDAPDFSRRARHGQRLLLGHSRGGCWARCRIRARSSGRTVPAFGATGSGAAGLVSIVRGTLRLLSWAPAGTGRSSRLH